MWIRRCALVAVTLVAAGVATAQAPKSDAAASAAMERVQRQAANPMRVILEAGKGHRRLGEPEPVANGAETPGVRRAAVKAAGRPAAAAVPAHGDAIAAQRAVATRAASMAESLRTAAAITEVPALTAAAPVAAITTMPATAALRAELAATLVRPKLLTLVEPQIPQRVLDEIVGAVEVVADLSIRADGTVARVDLVPPVPRQVQRYVVAALEQWLFEPLAAARVHRVQLVFNTR